MNKTFAVAMVFKRDIASGKQEENLRLHIIRDCETKGDAFIKAFDNDKNGEFQSSGLFTKVALEVPMPVVMQPDVKKAINELASALYFSDSSDYRSHMRKALSALVGEPEESLTGERIQEIFNSSKGE